MVNNQPVEVAGWFIWEMPVVMSKNVLFPMVVAGILIILIVLFVSFGHLKHEREEELARLTGNDEQTRSIRVEADEYRIANRNQQLGILAVGFVIVLAAVVWWVGQRTRELEQPSGKTENWGQ